MRLRVIAVGTRMPAWVDAAFEDYRRRLQAPWRLTLTELPPARRRDGEVADVARRVEGRRLLALLGARELLVTLDEHGAQLTTLELARWLAARRDAGEALAFAVGGPDGLDDAVLARGRWRWSLSRLTLPHGLARVVLVEQLYRAASVLTGHPYHRP